jgi:phosphinothricin acetyltransferase
MIRPVIAQDIPSICEIYNHYIGNTFITFETETISTDEMEKRIEAVIASYPLLVLTEQNKVQGYAYALRWKARPAYKYSVESSIYLAVGAQGKGFGTQLYKDLLSELKHLGVHTVIGGIALPNDASVALHEKLGFLKVAHFKEVGFKFTRWIDVGYWQLRFGIEP